MIKLGSEYYEAYESIVDSNYFGVSSARIILKRPCQNEILQTTLIEFIQKFDYVTVINKFNDPLNNQWIGKKTSAFLVDINVQFSKKVVLSQYENNNSIVITNNIKECKEILSLAKSSFKKSRFLNDPYLPLDKARNVYADIAVNSSGKENNFFVSFKIKEIVVGFLLVELIPSCSEVMIKLIAVSENFQRKGYARSLLIAMEQYVASQNLRTINVGTQVDNFDAVAMYLSCGFSFKEVNSVYHCWPNK